MDDEIDQHRSGETTIVVPCYEEAVRLDPAAISGFLRCHGDISLLMVDDGSTDETPQVLDRLRRLHPRQVFVLRLHSNVGKAEAVRRGVRLAVRRRPAMVGYWDADLATPLEAIPRFQTLLLERPELWLVMGSRVALLGRQIGRRPLRHLLGRAFATAASIVLDLPVYDTQCGAKLFRVMPHTIALFEQPFRTRWIFDVEVLARMRVLCQAGGLPPACELIYEYPLERWQEIQGSRLRLRDFFVAGLDLGAIHWRYMRRRAAVAEGAMLLAEVRRATPDSEHRAAA